MSLKMPIRQLSLSSLLVWTMLVATPLAAPIAPTALSAAVNGTTVTLTWTASSGATGYRLEAGFSAGTSNAANLVIGTTPSYVATQVPAGTYFVRVRAIDGSGESAASNEVTVVVGASAACSTAPAPPSSVSATTTPAAIGISWAPSGGCPATSYILQAGSGRGAVDIASINVGNVASFAASAPNGVYFLRLLAVNAFGVSAPSTELRIAIGDEIPPASGGATEVNLSTVSVGPDPSGNTVIIGLVSNRSLATVAFAKVNASVQGSGGHTTASGTTYVRGFSRAVGGQSIVTDTTLAPGETGCFHAVLPVPRASVSRVGLSVDALPEPVRPLAARPELIGVPGVGNVGGRVQIAGQMRNSGGATAYFTKVVSYVLRADSLAVGCDQQFLSGGTVSANGVTTDTAIFSGETRAFAANTSSPAPALATNLWVQWDEGANPTDPQTHAAIAALSVGTAEERQRARDLWDTLEATRERRYRGQ